jgi:hypothetical protein
VNPLVVILIVAFAFSTGFLLGATVAWNGSARRRNEERATYRATLPAIQQEIDELNTQLETDPVRAGIDTGKDYVVHRVQSELDRIREEAR